MSLFTAPSAAPASPTAGSPSAYSQVQLKTILTVQIADGTRKKLAIGTDSTIAALMAVIREKFEIPETPFLQLCSRTVDPSSGSVVDRWLHSERTITEESIGRDSELHYIFKLIKLPADVSDGRVLELLYLQIRQSILDGKYSCSERLAVRLAALSIQTTMGDYDPTVHKSGYLSRMDISNFLPFTVTAHSSEYWQRRFFRQHQILKGMAKAQAQKLYVQLARSYIPNFGLHFFTVDDESRLKVLVGVGEDGLFVYDPREFSVLQSVPLGNVTAVEATEDGFIIKSRVTKVVTESIASEDKEITFFCNSVVASAAVDLVQSYKEALTSELYIEPIMRYATIPGEFESRLEFFKYIFCELCSVNGVPINETFCERLDHAIDDDVMLESLDLSYCDIDGRLLSLVAEATVQAAQYKSSHGMFDENVNVVTVDVSHNRLASDAVQGLMTLLDALPDIVTLNLSYNQLDNQVYVSLAEILGKCRCISVLNLGHNDLGNKGIKAVLQACEAASLMTVVNVSANRISDIGAESIAQFVKERPSIIELDVSFNEIGNIGMSSICSVLGGSNCIRHLNLSHNSFTPSAVSLPTIFRSGNLVNVSLAGCKISCDVAAEIAHTMLSSSSNIVTLDLSSNQIGSKFLPEQVRKFGEIISSDLYDRLQDLNLADNGIDLAFCRALAECLPQNISLQTLNLSENPLVSKDTGYCLEPTFFQNLLKMKGLSKLSLASCGLKGEGIHNAFAIIRQSQNSTLLDVSFEGNELAKGESVWQCLSDPSCCLRSINMSKCKVTDTLFMDICGGLKLNLRLQRLELRENGISNKGVDQVASLLSSNRSLAVVDLRLNPNIKDPAAARDLLMTTLVNPKQILV
jgi:Ran GTPase-activating protein (RanGAP) involved in mRNA processing and transport